MPEAAEASLSQLSINIIAGTKEAAAKETGAKGARDRGTGG
eukprot:CAMPEP_0184301486 /NCGR_PEP_ID=MMETSP1049-20130417/11674_1 /TAXON_ID=77928 /ORGANISM="Proteomonas sulcata, Strain CCMP704" /LENGTH=40 /DNA_ID= /DNA_START= /DNA_END= /DNA_ORIENTATION=